MVEFCKEFCFYFKQETLARFVFNRARHTYSSTSLLFGCLGLLLLLNLELAVLRQNSNGAVGRGALLQGVVGDGDQLVALLLGVAQLETIKVVEGSTLKDKYEKTISGFTNTKQNELINK